MIFIQITKLVTLAQAFETLVFINKHKAKDRKVDINEIFVQRESAGILLTQVSISESLHLLYFTICYNAYYHGFV
jgi:hypothetical protein